MARAIEMVNAVQDELERIRAEIKRLMIEEDALSRVLSAMKGEAPAKKRHSNVKQVVLDIMRAAGSEGATSAEVYAKAVLRIPGIARDTVGSSLSRLKGDGALRYDNVRYYDVSFGARGDGGPFERAQTVN